MAKSIKHRDNLKKLAKQGTDKETIGSVQVCFDPEFCIGTGSGGTSVFLGLHEDASEVAVKRVLIKINKHSNRNTHEKEILSLLDIKASKHIVNYRGFVYKNPFTYLICDLCEETLEDYVAAHDEEHLKRHGPVIIREILTGLSVLHGQEKKILHLDLKPQNILVDSKGHMRLADFGISRILNIKQTTLETGQMGTHGWIAAESLGKPSKFKPKSDIQVAGMISFYVLTKGKHPFGNVDYCIPINIIKGKPVNLNQLSDFSAKDFVARMISHEIEERPSADEALKHRYLQIKPEENVIDKDDKPQLQELPASHLDNAQQDDVECLLKNKQDYTSNSFHNNPSALVGNDSESSPASRNKVLQLDENDNESEIGEENVIDEGDKPQLQGSPASHLNNAQQDDVEGLLKNKQDNICSFPNNPSALVGNDSESNPASRIRNQFGNKLMDGGDFASPGDFMANTSFDSQAMSHDKQKSRKSSSMVPVTVALIKNSTYNNMEDVCEIDGIKLYQVSFVGLICEVQENTTHLAYEIDDLTGGPITVKRWIDKEDNMEDQSQFREDTYVRVYGYIKVHDGEKKTIVAFSVNRLVDFNELTYHMLAVIYARLKMKEIANADNSTTSPVAGGNMQFGNFTGGQRDFGQNMDNSGMSTTQARVLRIISGTNSSDGMGMSEIQRKMQGVSESDIRKAVEFLSNEGHVYSTIDDDHFRSTND